MGKHDRWDVREPASIIGEMVNRCRARPGDVLVGLVTAGDEPDQAVTEVARVHRGDRPPRFEASDLLRARAESMAGERPWVDGRWMPPRHVLVTVVCRSGRVVPGPDELFWLLAWRYSNHLAAAFNGDVYLVTEHGWSGCMDKRADVTPALQARPAHLSVLPPNGSRLPRPATAVSASPPARTAAGRRRSRAGE